jgi:hypothetical protein
MKSCLIAVSILALSLLSQNAVASDGPAGSEVTNHHGDYINKDVPTLYTKPFKAPIILPKKRGRVGNFVDETIEEQNQRSSNH